MAYTSSLESYKKNLLHLIFRESKLWCKCLTIAMNVNETESKQMSCFFFAKAHQTALFLQHRNLFNYEVSCTNQTGHQVQSIRV